MFIKNDTSFICNNCGMQVEKLGYTSRDHCNRCLYSLHVDINPGDRLNKCKGRLRPINIEVNNKTKSKDIIYRCEKCGKIIKNIIAIDDNEDEMYKIIKNYAENGGI